MSVCFGAVQQVATNFIFTDNYHFSVKCPVTTREDDEAEIDDEEDYYHYDGYDDDISDNHSDNDDIIEHYS